MNVSINFPNEIENALRLRAAATGQDVESVVRQLVSESLQESELVPVKTSTHEEFMTRLRGIINLHPTSHGRMDDSRESIYAGRGE